MAHQHGGFLLLVMIVQGKQAGVNRKMLQEQAGMAGIFSRNKINALQHGERTLGNIR